MVTPHSSTTPKPAHVPDALVYDFDLFRDPALLADPHARILDIVQHAPPIFWTPRNGGHWMVTSYEDNFEVSRTSECFSSEFIPKAQVQAMLAMLPPDAPRIPMMVPIFLDPPEHTKYRLPLASAFSPKTINALKGDIRSLAASLVEKVANQGGCEFMSAIAEPLPVHVFLKMMGLPLERMREFRDLVRECVRGAAEPVEKAVATSLKIVAAMRESFLERKQNPRDDLISLLWNIEIDGRPTTLEDLEDFGALLFVAGLDTVMLAMGFAARHLAANPSLQRQLRAEPDLIPEASEEMLRRYTFISPVRRVAKDLQFQGVSMKEHEKVICFLPGADLDGRRFPNPERYDLEREDKTHLVFNAGPHRCLGSHLARIEIQILYEELLSRLPEFRLDPDHAPVFHGGNNIGLESLHIVWDT